MSENNEYETNLPKWQIEETHSSLVEPLKNILKEVYDPEIHLSVIDLGLIRDVQIGESEAQITMILTSPFCPYAPILMESVKQKAENVINKPINVSIGTEYWTPSMIAEDQRMDWGLY